LKTWGAVAHGYGCGSKVPLNVAGLVGDCARVPTSGTVHNVVSPARKKRTARVVRAEIGCEELVFMG